MDINRKSVAKNGYRITKVRGKTALRIRVPGGHLDAKFLPVIQQIAETYGDGSVHLTTRQGFELPGIAFKAIPEINAKLKSILEGLEVAIGVGIENPATGYPAVGTRNISACIGNRVCPFANVDTTRLAQTVEKIVYPNNYHVKIAVTGCPNDCIKAHMQDFGIIGICEPQYDATRCIGCEACVKVCKAKVTEALTMVQGKVSRDPARCIGCGECVLACPTAAWTRNPKKFYRVIIMGRTGKRNPKIAMSFLNWVEESAILKVLQNTYAFIDQHIDKTLDKEHVGYIVDRAGYETFKQCVLKDVPLNPEAKVADRLDPGGYRYPA